MTYEDAHKITKPFREKWEVKFPRKGTKRSIVLVHLIKNIYKGVTKEELTEVVRKIFPDTNDVQDGRHLKNSGWNVINERKFKKTTYTLVSLDEPHPIFLKNRKVESKDLDWNGLKKEYDYMCATCGCKEGEIHRYYFKKVKLQKGHKNPSLPLNRDNVIPQCQFCNRQDRDKWVYDNNGRVKGISNIKDAVKFLHKSGRLNELVEEMKKYE